ncbi:MAG: threonine/serine exporter family protein [Fibrobacteres bacterium]|nr:threonine/serine exporter family protein [Fibrobacterota bacterium]
MKDNNTWLPLSGMYSEPVHLNGNSVIHFAADAAQVVLENGGETYRAQETFERIAKACGMVEADAFIVATGIIANITDKGDKSYSISKKVMRRTIHLEKVSLVNSITRDLENGSITPVEARTKIRSLSTLKNYPLWIQVIAAAVSASLFSRLFGGSFTDLPAAFIIGALLRLFIVRMDERGYAQFFYNAAGGFIASFLALCAAGSGFANNADYVITGVIMLLVPGVSIVNAIRDTIASDIIAGTARAVEAFVLAVAIALGTGIALQLWSVIS